MESDVYHPEPEFDFAGIWVAGGGKGGADDGRESGGGNHLGNYAP